jgi:hypothetical protein
VARRSLRRLCYRHLAGVGDRAHEWFEDTGFAVHLRRRLTAAEAAAVGPVVDIRGTPEARARYAAARDRLPPVAHQLAVAELRERGAPA